MGLLNSFLVVFCVLFISLNSFAWTAHDNITQADIECSMTCLRETPDLHMDGCERKCRPDINNEVYKPKTEEECKRLKRSAMPSNRQIWLNECAELYGDPYVPGTSDEPGNNLVPTPPGDIQIPCETVCPGDKCPTRCQKENTPSPTNPPKDEEGVVETPVTCVEDFSAEIAACNSAIDKAANSCDENSSTLSNVSNLVSQASMMMGQKSASSINDSCSRMATLGKGVSAGLILYRQYCGASIDNCKSTCSTTLLVPKCGDTQSLAKMAAAKQAINKGRLSCNSFIGKMNDAAAAAENYTAITVNSESCSSLTAAAASGPADLCAKNPDSPGCGAQEKMDCTNPKMAGYKVCVCKGNPNHAMCRSQVASSDQSSLQLADRLKERDRADLASNQDKLQQLPYNPSESDPINDGKQGGDPNLSAKLNASANDKRLKGKKGFSDRNVLGGFYGGSSTAAKANKAEPMALIEDKPIKPREPSSEKESEEDEAKRLAIQDLERFLPGRINAPRGFAGSGEKIGDDGITGPNSDIWNKVKNRYEALKGSLLP